MTFMQAAPRDPARAAVRVAAATAVSVCALLLIPGTAYAHVQLHPDATTTGSFSALTFRVPNESPTAGTVKVSVQLPQQQPFLEVSTKPVPGWKASVTEAALPKPVQVEGTTITKAVRTVTWTADRGVRISSGEYQEFSISVGPLPLPGTVLLPTNQTYSDGTVTHWNQPTPASGAEPERPAPALTVTAAESAGASQPASSAAPASAEVAGRPSDDTARWLGGSALVVALAALGLAALGRPRSRRSG